jgi:hypothetical protein
MRTMIVVAAMLSLSGCISIHGQSTEGAQLVQSAPLATSNTSCSYVGGQLNCMPRLIRTTSADVKGEKPPSN